MLGQDFLPYMDIVMPPLLKAAQLKPDVNISDASSDLGDEDDVDDEVFPMPPCVISPNPLSLPLSLT